MALQYVTNIYQAIKFPWNKTHFKIFLNIFLFKNLKNISNVESIKKY